MSLTLDTFSFPQGSLLYGKAWSSTMKEKAILQNDTRTPESTRSMQQQRRQHENRFGT